MPAEPHAFTVDIGGKSVHIAQLEVDEVGSAPSRLTSHTNRRGVPAPPSFDQLQARRDVEGAIRSMEQWGDANASERHLLQETIDLARDLFLTTIAGQYRKGDVEDEFDDPEVMSMMVAESSSAESNRPLTPRSAAVAEIMGSGRKVLQDSENYRETRNNVMRAAVSCLMLERMCAVFSRYHSVLGSLNEMIFRSVYVPDTEEMRSTLGGTVRYPLKDVPLRFRSLLAPYARKTYFVAHDEVAAQVMALAKSNRAIEVRLSRQGKIFDKTVKHWVASIIRNLFLSWRGLMRRRKMLRLRFHAKFARLRVEDLKAKVISNWRARAAAVRRAALIEAGAGELQQLTLSAEALQDTISGLSHHNNALAERINAQEKERVMLQDTIAEKEKLFIELQTRTMEMDRVGIELLDSMLQAEPLPSGANAIEVLVAWGHRMIDDAGGPEEGEGRPLAPLLSDAFYVTVPLSALAAVMSRFNSPNAPTREEVTMVHNAPQRAAQLVVDMYERLVESPCLVNAEQIGSMQRGVLLLFLAGLLRHMSNWVVSKPPQIPQARKVASSQNLTTSPTSAASIKRQQSRKFGTDGSGSMDFTPGDLAPTYTTWMDRVRVQQQWIATSMAALHTALEISTQRPPAFTSEEQEDMVTFLDLTVGHLIDILPPNRPGGLRADTVFVQLLSSLQQLFPDLRKVYLSYAVPTLQFMDFVRLVKDCRLLGPNKLTKRDVDTTCREVYQRHAATQGGGHNVASKDDHDGSDDDTSAPSSTAPSYDSHSRAAGSKGLATPPPHHLTSSESSNLSPSMDMSIRTMEPKVFVECIVRTSLLHHRRLTRDPSLCITPSMVSSFILETIVPHALRLDVDRFRQTARHPLVRQVLAKHKYTLRRAFRRYATANDGESISKLQFQQMAKDCKWHATRTIGSDVVAEVFRRCKSEADRDGTVEGLDLGDWLEAICALSVYADPNPLVPLAVKLPVFIEEKILSAIQL